MGKGADLPGCTTKPDSERSTMQLRCLMSRADFQNQFLIVTFTKLLKDDMKYEELVKNHAAELIEKLVTDVVTKDPVEIRFDFEDDDQWAIISMHIYEEDKEISVKLHANNRYALYFGYYDDEDEFFEITKTLTEEEKDGLPKRLRKVMEKYWPMRKACACPAIFYHDKTRIAQVYRS